MIGWTRGAMNQLCGRRLRNRRAHTLRGNTTRVDARVTRALAGNGTGIDCRRVLRWDARLDTPNAFVFAATMTLPGDARLEGWDADVVTLNREKTRSKNRDQHHNKSIARFTGIYNIRIGLSADGTQQMNVDATQDSKNFDEILGRCNDAESKEYRVVGHSRS